MRASAATVRRLGLVAMIGGAAMLVANVLLLLRPGAGALDSAADDLVEGVVVLSLLVTLAGVVGVHLRQAEAYGALGTVAFLLALLGQAATVADVFSLNQVLFAVTNLPGVVGFFLLALAISRSPRLPHWTGFVLFVGFVAFGALREADFGIALDGVVWIVVGYALRAGWTELAIASRAPRIT